MFRIFVKDREGVVRRVTELTSVFQYNQTERCAAIRELCELLGLSSSFGVGQEVTRERVTSAVGCPQGCVRSAAAVQHGGRRLQAGYRISESVLQEMGVHGAEMRPAEEEEGQGDGLVEETVYIVQEQAAFKGYGSRVCVLRCPK